MEPLEERQLNTRLKYIIFFFIPEAAMQSFVFENNATIDHFLYVVTWSIIGFQIFFFLVIGLIVIIFTKRITRPIQKLTKFTIEL